MTEAEDDSQNGPAEDTTPERLELAKTSFEQIEGHVVSLESKARTFLTVNSLLVGAGLLSAARGVTTLPGGLTLRILLVFLAFGLLGFVAAAFSSLFAVLSVRRFEGHPRASSTLVNLASEDARTLRESLAQYYARAADDNLRVAESMVEDLKRAVVRTRRAFWSFVGLTAILVSSNVPIGELQMQSTPDAPQVSTSDSGISPGGSQPAPTSQPAQPAPKPIEGIPIERGEPPMKIR